MNLSLFPPLFEKKKQEELQAYTDTREREFTASVKALDEERANRERKVSRGWTRGDVSYFDYWKSMYYLFLIIFALIGAIIGPIALIEQFAPEQLIGKILVIVLGIPLGILVSALVCIFSCTIPLTLLIIIISPLVYFLIYPLSRKAKDNKREKQLQKLRTWYEQNLSLLQEQKESDLKVHRETTEHEIREYRALFESQVHAKTDDTARGPVAKNATEWLLTSLLTHLAKLDRDENIKTLEATFSFSIDSGKVSVGKKKLYLTEPLEMDVEKMTLAHAVVQNITCELPEDSAYQDLGDVFLSFTPSYDCQTHISAVTITLKYQATNGAYLQHTQQKN